MTAQGLFRATGPRLFLRRVRDDLLARQNCVMLLPRGVDRSVLSEAIRGALWSQLDVAELPDDLVADNSVAPLDAVADTLGIASSRERLHGFDALLRHDGLPDVVEIPSLDGVTKERAETWVDFVSTWAAHLHRSPQPGPFRPVFLLTLQGASATRQAPRPEVRLALHAWQGVVSAIDLRQLWRLDTRLALDSEAAVWVEHIVGSLSGDDLELAVSLGDVVLQGQRAVVASLTSVALARGWTDDRARRAASALDMLPLGTVNGWHAGRTSGAVAEGWADGLIRLTPEYGAEISSAALALLGAEHQIRHRIWRGQAAMVLPLCDAIRLALCDDLTRRFGSEWVCWHPADDPNEVNEVRQNPYSAQLGHLESILRTPLAADRAAWLAVANAARHLRNELAHYRPVAFKDFERLCRLASLVRGARRGAGV